MRLLKGNSITLSKLIGICNGFDISCVMTLKDKEDAVNPIGDEIVIDLTDGRNVKGLGIVKSDGDDDDEDSEFD